MQRVGFGWSRVRTWLAKSVLEGVVTLTKTEVK
jgi:hypothetical protein